jgi:glyoxylate reductase
VLVESTADIAFALILIATRRLGEAERMVRSGATWSWGMFYMLGMGLQDKTLGIVGLGKIGTATARRARAFGMRIAYAGRRRADPALEAELGAALLDLDELLATADVVSIHCPLSAETRHLIDARRLALMRPTAYLVNTARGPIVDEAALAAALRAGSIAGAGLDVFEREPIVEPGLLDLENVVLIPHLGSATIETRTAMGVLAARNAVAVLAGQAPLTPIA